VTDEYPDVAFPPTDCGSSGLGVCKVLKACGLIGSYQWATTLDGLAALLQRGSVWRTDRVPVSVLGGWRGFARRCWSLPQVTRCTCGAGRRAVPVV
jgi:hypothetical protein